MSERSLENANLQMVGYKSKNVTIAAIIALVLIVFAMIGCFLTSLIMVLDAIPFHHIFTG